MGVTARDEADMQAHELAESRFFLKKEQLGIRSSSVLYFKYTADPTPH